MSIYGLTRTFFCHQIGSKNAFVLLKFILWLFGTNESAEKQKLITAVILTDSRKCVLRRPTANYFFTSGVSPKFKHKSSLTISLCVLMSQMSPHPHPVLGKESSVIENPAGKPSLLRSPSYTHLLLFYFSCDKAVKPTCLGVKTPHPAKSNKGSKLDELGSICNF